MSSEVSRELTADAVSPAQARTIVRRMLALWDHHDDEVQVAELLTSELVTNAVRHAATAIVLHVLLDDSTVRIEVTDLGAGMPRIRRSAPDASGYGLQIVERLATRWGVDPIPDQGKTVWFELEVTNGVGDTRGATR